MRRRCLLAVALGAALLVGIPSMAGQSAEKARRIGVLLTLPPSVPAVRPLWQALVDGLREHGWEEGRNLILEGRFTGQDTARYPDLAAELVALKVDAIIAGDSQAIEAARRQTATIPIIMLFTSDPVRSGFVASLARPGGNITGLSGQYESLAGKTLELLKEVKPTINRVGIIFSSDNIGSAATVKEQQEKMAPDLGLIALPIPISGPADFDGAFATIVRERPQALDIHPTPVVLAHRQQIAAFAIEQRLPTATTSRFLVPEGLLMSYSPDLVATFRHVASYVDAILRGAKPAELPVEQLAKFQLVINLKTARAIGLDLPESFLLRADEVIE
jgi:putative ABC transport system substrate-binding protein